MTDLQGRIALVTGASRGIGRAIALRLAREGAAIGVNYRVGQKEAEEVVAEIRSTGGSAMAFQADVSDPEQFATMVQEVLDGMGGLHILVNNAGIARDGLISDLTPDDWIEVMRVNFGGVFNGTKAVLDHFARQGDGVIVNISSVLGERPWRGTMPYAASKAAINAFTRSCGLELARFGIRVNTVLAGLTETSMHKGLAGERGRGVRQIPMRHAATPEQIADVAAFLAGPNAAYMAGALVAVDGGISAYMGLGAPE